MLPTGRSRKLSTSVPLRWGIGANRLCPLAAVIPPPSFRRRAAALGRPAQGGRVAHTLALYRSLAVGLLAAVLFRHCGAFGPLGGSLPGPGACRSGRGRSGRPLRRPPAAARRIRLLASGLASPWAASAPRPPPGLCSVVGGPGPGLWAPEGPGVAPPFGSLRRPSGLLPPVASPAPLSPSALLGLAWLWLCFAPAIAIVAAPRRAAASVAAGFSLPPPPPLPPRWGSRGARGLRPWGLPPPLRSPCSCGCFRRCPRGWCFLRRYAGRGQFYQGGSGFRA